MQVKLVLSSTTPTKTAADLLYHALEISSSSNGKKYFDFYHSQPALRICVHVSAFTDITRAPKQ